MSFADFMTEDRRLCILRLLSESQQGSLNDSVLLGCLERLAHAVARDVVKGDLAWLRDMGLLELEDVMGRVTIATIRQRGVDVAHGRTTVPGIKRPSPRS